MFYLVLLASLENEKRNYYITIQREKNGIAASMAAVAVVLRQFLPTWILIFCPVNGVITVTTKQIFRGNLYLTLSCSCVSIGTPFNFISFAATFKIQRLF